MGWTGASTKEATNGILHVPIGEFWLNGQSLKGGIIPLQLYRSTQQLLKTLIERDHAKPSFVFDREFKIEEALEAFREFSDHKLVKAVIRFDKKVHMNGNYIRDPLEGEPVRKRNRFS